MCGMAIEIKKIKTIDDRFIFLEVEEGLDDFRWAIFDIEKHILIGTFSYEEDDDSTNKEILRAISNYRNGNIQLRYMKEII
jgi:hypothetical protein